MEVLLQKESRNSRGNERPNREINLVYLQFRLRSAIVNVGTGTGQPIEV